MLERRNMTTYPAEARARIKRMPRDRFNLFLGEIPKRALKTVLRRLKPIDGFRPDSDAAMDEQRRRLLKRLTEDAASSFGSDSYWSVFQSLWFQWVQHKLHSSPILAPLKSFINAEDADRKVALEDLLLVCMNEAEQRSISREILAGLFEFGPFCLDADTEEVVAAASLGSDLTGQQLLARLPPILNDIEARFKSVEKIASELETQIDRLAEETKPNAANDRDQAKRLKLITDDLELIKRSHAELSGQNELIARKFAAFDIASLSKRVSSLESNIAQYRLDWDQRSKTLSASVAEIQQNLSTRAVTGVGARPTSGSSSSEREISFENFEVPFDFSRHEKEIQSASELAHAIGQNLISVGMNREQTTRVGMEICAALCSGQFVTLSGSFGVLTALAAMVATSSITRVAYVPIGCHDSRGGLERKVRDACTTEMATNFFFDGANRSALDAYADGLIEMVLLRQSGIVCLADASFFCRTVDGPTGLAPTPAYTSIGPVIDTDAMSWRKNTKEIALFCRKKGRGPLSFGDAGHTAPDSLKDLMALLDTATTRNRKGFELTVRNAAAWLHSIGPSLKVDDSGIGASLLASWFLPYVRSCGMREELAAKQLGTTPAADLLTDTRVAALLGRPNGSIV